MVGPALFPHLSVTAQCGLGRAAWSLPRDWQQQHCLHTPSETTQHEEWCWAS